MTEPLTRRDFVAGSALVAGAPPGLGPTAARAATLAPPEGDRPSIRVGLHSSHDIFIDKPANPLVKVERVADFPGKRVVRPLDSQWGLSLYIESTAGDVTRRQMLDFGSTADVLANNVELLGIKPA